MHDLYVCRTLNSSALTHAEDSDLLFMTTANSINKGECVFVRDGVTLHILSMVEAYFRSLLLRISYEALSRRHIK